MSSWIRHTAVYVIVCTFISLVWVVLTSGTFEDLGDYVSSPADAFRPGFWPIFFWLAWGLGWALHTFALFSRILLPGRRRRRRERRLRHHEAMRAAHDAGAAVLAGRPPVGRGYVVAMFTDLSGSTSTNEQVGDGRWAEIVGHHRSVVRRATASHGGVEVGTQGDGFFVRFDQPLEAVACAVRIQRDSAAARGSGQFVPPVRIGVHLGEAIHDDDDVLGQVVNVAARLLEVARPHEILVTEPVADSVELVAYEDRGLVNLKGITQPRHVLAVSWD